MKTTKEIPPIEKQAYKIAEFCVAYGVGRSKAYEEIKAARLKTFKVGGITLIAKEDASAWMNLCRNAADLPVGV